MAYLRAAPFGVRFEWYINNWSSLQPSRASCRNLCPTKKVLGNFHFFRMRHLTQMSSSITGVVQKYMTSCTPTSIWPLSQTPAKKFSSYKAYCPQSKCAWFEVGNHDQWADGHHQSLELASLMETLAPAAQMEQESQVHVHHSLRLVELSCSHSFPVTITRSCVKVKKCHAIVLVWCTHVIERRTKKLNTKRLDSSFFSIRSMKNVNIDTRPSVLAPFHRTCYASIRASARRMSKWGGLPCSTAWWGRCDAA